MFLKWGIKDAVREFKEVEVGLSGARDSEGAWPVLRGVLGTSLNMAGVWQRVRIEGRGCSLSTQGRKGRREESDPAAGQILLSTTEVQPLGGNGEIFLLRLNFLPQGAVSGHQILLLFPHETVGV